MGFELYGAPLSKGIPQSLWVLPDLQISAIWVRTRSRNLRVEADSESGLVRQWIRHVFPDRHVLFEVLAVKNHFWRIWVQMATMLSKA